MGRFYLVSIVFTLLAWSFGSCGNASPDNTADGDATTTPARLSPDSLRRAYRQYYEARSDWMPEKAVIEAGKLYPVDAAPLDTSFFVFREHLRQAVTDRDIFSVMETIDEDIQCGADKRGLPAFVTTWGLESEEGVQSSALWRVLAEVLAGGGTFSDKGKQFVAPYTFSNFPKDIDPSTHAIITGAGVRLRAAPGLNTPTLTMVSHDIVELLSITDQTETIAGETYPWVHIRLSNGKEGYIWGKFIAKPMGFRAIFRRSGDDRWKMIALLENE